MKNKWYDLLKWFAQYFLPALGTLYFALSGIWHFPCGEQIVGTITAVDVFLGVLLGISSAKYNKNKDGTFLIDTTNPEKDIFRLVLDHDLGALTNKSIITLNVDNGADLSQK